jgi:hypothetical protein
MTTDTVPLPQAKLLPSGSEHISQGGYRFEALPGSADLLVLVAMSGGGKRSAAYAYGALKGMREVNVPAARGQSSLLSSLDGSRGSPGQFPSGLLWPLPWTASAALRRFSLRGHRRSD